MTNQEKIRYLSQYVDIGKEYQIIANEYAELGTQMENLKSQVISDMPKGDTQDNYKIEKIIDKRDELEKQLLKKMNELLEYRIKVDKVINGVEKSRERILLRNRYILGLKWEEICCEMFYSWKGIHKVHYRAINMIEL